MGNIVLSFENQIIEEASYNYELTKEDINCIVYAAKKIKDNYRIDFNISNNLYRINLFKYAPEYYEGTEYGEQYQNELKDIINNFKLAVSLHNYKYKVYSYFDNRHGDNNLNQQLSEQSIRSYNDLVYFYNEIEDFIISVGKYIKLSFTVAKTNNSIPNIEI